MKNNKFDLANSRVLLIGGAGLVGSHLAEELLKEDIKEIIIFDNFVRGSLSNLSKVSSDKRVKIIKADILDEKSLNEASKNIDFIFHLAALWLLHCQEKPTEGFETNVKGTINVLEAAKNNKIKKVIFSSSASVYGDPVVIPMTEEHPFNNRTMYGATKISGEQFFRFYYSRYGLDYLALRYFNIYGPRQDYHGAYVSVIMKALDRIKEGNPPIIHGDGSQAYDFIYVRDVARANILALKSPATDEAINIASGIKTSINEIVELILELTKSNLKPQYEGQKPEFVTERKASVDKAKKLLGFSAEVNLRSGLKELIEWRINQDD
ncbi:MAG: NAD-dependent epimerase/dehydratase family protein [Candidatus Omnitrophota bacterium]|nr:NAD-dependent epimerase/dehydratase family protein [Candidatus Omnitrophota bacterium]